MGVHNYRGHVYMSSLASLKSHWSSCGKTGKKLNTTPVPLGTKEGAFCTYLANKINRAYARLPGVKPQNIPDWRLLRDTHTHTHTHTPVHTHRDIHNRNYHTHIHTLMCTGACTHIHNLNYHTHTHTHRYAYTKCTLTRAHTYAFTNVHPCIYTHAQPKCTHAHDFFLFFRTLLWSTVIFFHLAG